MSGKVERMKKQMPAEKPADLYQELKEAGIKVWLDGGWGVDALLGEQTRPHDDVDFVVQAKDLNALAAILKGMGYKDVPRDDTRAWNFVLGDDSECEVDIHVININENGDGIYGPPENGEAYPTYALKGVGAIHGREVLCMSLAYQLVNHTGYKLRDKGFQDIRNLCQKFGCEPPEEYRRKI